MNPQNVRIWLDAPAVARNARAGQFVILRVDEGGERIPLTIASMDKQKGEISLIFHPVGASTMKLAAKREGECISDLVGPLGKPTEVEGFKRVAVIGGGTATAIAMPLAKAFKDNGAFVHGIVAFRNRDVVILEDEFRAASSRFDLISDDGSTGRKGNATDLLREALERGERYDRVVVIGSMPMMKSVADLTRQYGIKTIVSMNPIMVDGTGMCGGCRLTVGGKTVFACVDGPEFDAHEVDFDQSVQRLGVYADFERHALEETCNLLKAGEKDA